MKHAYRIGAAILILALLAVAAPVSAQAPANLLVNPGFEGGIYNSQSLGTSLSSNVAEGWTPWSVLGDATWNREVEYKVINATDLGSRYHIRSGNQAQKFFTSFGTHTAGFYQRVRVGAGQRVTFSIWVQIYTGERELYSAGHVISDLERPPADPGRRAVPMGPGDYVAWAGIDPTGATPSGFGAPPSDATVWSASVKDVETRVVDPSGEQRDAWVLLEVSAVSQGEFVTVYAKGQPAYPVKHNDTFWDDASLVLGGSAPVPTATPVSGETGEPTAEGEMTPTPAPTATPAPSGPTPGQLVGSRAGSYAFSTALYQTADSQTVTLTFTHDNPSVRNAVGVIVYGPMGEVARSQASVGGERSVTFTPLIGVPYTVQVYNYLDGIPISYTLEQ